MRQSTQIHLPSHLWVLFPMLLLSILPNSCSGTWATAHIRCWPSPSPCLIKTVTLTLSPICPTSSNAALIFRPHTHTHKYMHACIQYILYVRIYPPGFSPQSKVELKSAVAMCFKLPPLDNALRNIGLGLFAEGYKCVVGADSKTLLAINKPKGYVVTRSDELGRKTVYNLLPNWVFHDGWMPIGRLDLESTGLLLFTTNGKIGDALTNPGNCIKV